MSQTEAPWLDSESQDAIDLFWLSAGASEDFPRTLERPLALALPVALVKLPHLRLKDVEHWLRARSVPFSFNCQSRAMRGCLVAFAGQGVIFVDGADHADEQRVSVAHEIAHFLVDYWVPRKRAVVRFGSQILEAFDGQRALTISERLAGILQGATLGVHTDLMERGPSSDFERTWRIESRADRLGMALLAPPDDVLSRLGSSAPDYRTRLAALCSILDSSYGLPAYVSCSYAAELLHSAGKGPSWTESLRHVIKQQNVELRRPRPED